jgi:hypothetical protein
MLFSYCCLHPAIPYKHSDTRCTLPGVIPIPIVFLQMFSLMYHMPGVAKHRRKHFLFIPFLFFSLCKLLHTCLIDGLVNIWTGSNVYILANNTHVALNATNSRLAKTGTYFRDSNKNQSITHPNTTRASISRLYVIDQRALEDINMYRYVKSCIVGTRAGYISQYTI